MDHDNKSWWEEWCDMDFKEKFYTIAYALTAILGCCGIVWLAFKLIPILMWLLFG